MTAYVALLRAVNVGKANRITMDRLRTGFLTAGYEDAVTYIQTGNVVFGSELDDVAVAKHVEDAVLAPIGLAVTVVVRSAAELARVVVTNPFLAADNVDPARLHVAFLTSTPTADAKQRFLAAADLCDDEVVVAGSEVYISFARGAGSTTLTPAIWNKLGVQATMRNWNVTRALADLAASHGRRQASG